MPEAAGAEPGGSQRPETTSDDSAPYLVTQPLYERPPERKPVAPKLPSKLVAITLSSVLAAGVGGWGIVAIVRSSASARDSTTAGTQPSTGGGPSSSPRSPAATTTSLGPRAPDPRASALAKLEQRRREGVRSVHLRGQWVAQIASKTIGIVDPLQVAQNGTHTFLARDILAEHEALRSGDNRGTAVVLLLSTDYGERRLHKNKPLWVTFALGSFVSPAEVRAWCGQRFPRLSGDRLTNACAPRQLKPVQ